MQTKKSIPLDDNTIGRAIRDAGYPSTQLPISTVIEAPYAAGAAGQKQIDIYAREDDPNDPLHFVLRARFASQESLYVNGGAAQLEREFTIDVDLSKQHSEATFTVH